MDAIVTARIPVEIKEQVNKILHDMGSSQSQLINLAFRYVLENKTLPGSESSSSGSSGKRKLSKQQLIELEESLRATTFNIPADFLQSKSYKEILEEGRTADYETLS